jgi:hypothetical protein
MTHHSRPAFSGADRTVGATNTFRRKVGEKEQNRGNPEILLQGALVVSFEPHQHRARMSRGTGNAFSFVKLLH